MTLDSTSPTAGPGPSRWTLYLLECASGTRRTIYTGITTDLEARLMAHRSGTGAKYTRANRPVRVIGTLPFADRASASSAEWRIKRLPRAAKLAFLQQQGSAPGYPARAEAARS